MRKPGPSRQSALDANQQADGLHPPAAAKRLEDLSPSSALRLSLAGSNANPSVTGADRLPGNSSYLFGADAGKWQTSLPTYAAVRYAGVYPGIDLVYYGNQGQLEYDFELAPGADPRRIRLDLTEAAPSAKGARWKAAQVRLDGGDLVITTPAGEVRFRKPVVYQTPSGAPRRAAPRERSYVKASYVVTGRRRVGFELGPYDHSRPLIIDPALNYATNIGSYGDDEGTSIAVDAGGNAYVTGYTASAAFPATLGAFQPACGAGCAGGSSYDAFVTKLDPAGAALIYSTFLGGSSSDYGQGIAVDGAGDAYVTGQTYSGDFPTTPGALQPSCGGCGSGTADAFVAELNPAGSGLVYSTYLGGSGYDQGNAIALDAQGDSYVTGWTASPNFPTTPGAPQPVYGGGPYDAFVSKLNPGGTSLLFSTYLGGSKTDVAYSIALDPSNDAYVTGYTCSPNFPTTSGAFQVALAGPTAAFVAKLDPGGSAIVYSTYLGGSGSGTGPCATCAASVAVDAAGEAYVAGLTWEKNFPTTPGAVQTTSGGGLHDAFVSKLNPSGSALAYSTLLGGSGDDGVVSIAVDASGNAYLRGNTFSPDFPTTPDAFQPAFGGSSDAFVAELSASGTALVYSSYLGGSGSEYGHATRSLALDGPVKPNIYVTGYTDSQDFPTTPGTFQTSLAGSNDAFVAKITLDAAVSLSPLSLGFGGQLLGTSGAPQTLTLTNTGTVLLSISAIAVAGANGADFAETNNCESTLEVGAACEVSVTFTPTATGIRAASITITDNGDGSPQSVALNGTGTAPAASLSPGGLAFGTQTVGTGSAPQSITLTNTGTAALALSAVAIGPDYTQSNNCGGVVTPGGSCTFTIIFDPTVTGPLNESLTITDSAPDSPQSAALTGTGTPVLFPVVSLSPSSLDFGGQALGAMSGPLTSMLVNSGTAPLNIAAIAITGADGGDFAQANTCGSSVPMGGSCTITVTFAPASKGARTASVSITDDGLDSPQSLGLTGTGTGSGNPVPQINEPIVPGATTPGSADVTLTVNGAGFVPGSVVNWNGTGLATTFVNSRQLSAIVPASDLVSSGTSSVSVASPGPGGGRSGAAFFAVTRPTAGVTLSRLDTAAGNSPQGLQAGDFNGDGNLDLAIVNSGDNTVSILLGGGDGTFGPATATAVGAAPVAVAAGDLNGDGTVDLAVANSGDNTITLLFGRGDGTFAPGPVLSVGSAPLALGVGDLNGDGALDLAIVDSADNAVAVLLGNGDGTFNSGLAPVTVGNAPGSVAVGDFNGDGNLDLAVTNSADASVSVLLGNGDGTFGAPVNVIAGAGPAFVTAADLNGDGLLDLAVANAGENTISILLGNGDGTFTPASTVATGSTPVALVKGDLNGDGILDLGVANSGDNTIAVMLGNGDGSFQASLSYATGAAPVAAAVGDLNSDGRLDLVAADQGSGSVSVLVQSPAVSASPASVDFGNQPVGTESGPQTVTLTNSGSAALDISSVAVGPDYTETNDCGRVVPIGAECTVTLSFSPTAAGPHNESVTITDNAAGSPQSVALTGTGTAPAVSLSPASLTFANQQVGTSSGPQAATLTNTGTAALNITSVAVTGVNGSDFTESNSCGSSLQPGASCNITITFTPTVTGTRTAAVTITDNAAGSPQSVALTGTGTSPMVSLLPGSLTFATQVVRTTSAAQKIILTNVGSLPLSISAVTMSGVNATDFNEVNTCPLAPSTLGAGSYCTFTMTFKPTAGGQRNASLTITDNALGSPQTVPLAGKGTVVQLQPASLSFGSVKVGKSSGTKSLTLTNLGAVALSLTGISVTGANAGDFKQTNTCGNSVRAGANCKINVVFTPSASGGRSASVSVSDNGGSSPQTVALTGSGS